VNGFQKQQATNQNCDWDPEVYVGQDAGQPVVWLSAIVDWWHGGFSKQEVP
jgi:hypothetical protein